MQTGLLLPILLFLACLAGLAVVLLILGNLFSPSRPQAVKRMPYESGMDPVHDTKRRFDVRFHLLAIAFLVFDVELLFLYPWAVVMHPPTVDVAPVSVVSSSTEGLPVDSVASQAAEVASIHSTPTKPAGAFFGGMVFLGLLVLGLVYDWRKGIFLWR